MEFNLWVFEEKKLGSLYSNFLFCLVSSFFLVFFWFPYIVAMHELIPDRDNAPFYILVFFFFFFG